ncbi:hypothetical protein [Kibdelosporangium persicum]|nr:hypothetical protein [Kibdelosporangium persicum]
MVVGWFDVVAHSTRVSRTGTKRWPFQYDTWIDAGNERAASTVK